MGGMGGGMRSVPPTGLPFADLKPGQTRNLPTCVVSLDGTRCRGRGAACRPRARSSGSSATSREINTIRRCRRRCGGWRPPGADKGLATGDVAVSGGLDWETIAQLSERMGEPLRADLGPGVRRSPGRVGRGDSGADPAPVRRDRRRRQASAADLSGVLEGKTMLGIQAVIGVPARPDGPSVACRVRLTATEALVQVPAATAHPGLGHSGKFTLPVAKGRRSSTPRGSPTTWPRGSSTAWSGRSSSRAGEKGKLNYGSDRQRLAADPQRAVVAGAKASKPARSEGPAGDRHRAAEEPDPSRRARRPSRRWA